MLQCRFHTAFVGLDVALSRRRYVPSMSKTLAGGLESWISVLKLATQWQFDDIRGEAISRLNQREDRDPVDLVTTGRDFTVSEWLIRGYTDLATKDRDLTEEETNKLGVDTTLKILKLRLEHHKADMHNDKFDAAARVEDLFYDELMTDEVYHCTRLWRDKWSPVSVPR